MNTSISLPRPPALKLPRATASQPSEDKWASKLEQERRRLEEDHEALRVREENLREYEARLRALQEQLEGNRPAPAVTATRTATPFARPPISAPSVEDAAALQAGWEKLHRAQELFESEQSHMKHERVIMHDKERELSHRERAVFDREQRVSERERLLFEAASAPQPVVMPAAAVEAPQSAMTRFTRAPFDMARSVFASKK